MSRFPKRLLAISLTAFAVGFVGVFGGPHIPVVLAIGMPVGAIFLGLFLVAYILQGEMAKFDAEQKSRLTSAQRYAAGLSERSPATAARPNPAAALATSHP